MMKTKFTVLFIIAFSLNLYAEAFFSGSVNSVNSDSGFNALRNPALMSGQDKDSMGFSYFYSYNAFTDISGDIAGVSGLDMDVSVEERYNGTISFSYVKKDNGNSYGFAIRKPEGADQGLISESTNKITATVPAIYTKTTEDKKSFAVSAVLSYSKELSRHESVGLQFETGISTVMLTKEIYDNGPPVEDYDMEITTNKVIGNMNCGYRFAANKYEIGAIMKFGEYAYEKQKYSYKDNLSSNNKDEEVSPYLYRNKGLEYTLGFGYNITNGFIFNIEANIGIPFESKKRELNDDDNGVMAEKNWKNYLNYSGGVTGGFNYKYSQNFNLGFGGGVATYKADSAGDYGIKAGESKSTVYSILTGAEIKLAGSVNLLFGFNTYYLQQSLKADSAVQSMTFEIDALYLNAIAGASTYF
jgi:hypothetical protein